MDNVTLPELVVLLLVPSDAPPAAAQLALVAVGDVVEDSHSQVVPLALLLSYHQIVPDSYVPSHSASQEALAVHCSVARALPGARLDFAAAVGSSVVASFAVADVGVVDYSRLERRGVSSVDMNKSRSFCQEVLYLHICCCCKNCCC